MVTDQAHKDIADDQQMKLSVVACQVLSQGVPTFTSVPFILSLFTQTTLLTANLFSLVRTFLIGIYYILNIFLCTDSQIILRIF